jgi:hypothetical protein
LNLKKIITIVSIGLISTLVVYGFILIGQIFADNTKFEKKCTSIFQQMQVLMMSRKYCLILQMDRFEK